MKKVKVTLNGETKIFPTDQDTYDMLDGMEKEGVKFSVEDYVEPVNRSPQAEMTVGEPEVLKAPQSEMTVGSPEVLKAPAQPSQAPTQVPWYQDLRDTTKDVAVSGLDGLSLHYGDEILGAFDEDAKNTYLANLAQAQSRSPTASKIANVGGTIATGAALSALTGPIGGGAVTAGLARSGAVETGIRDRLKEGAIGAGQGALFGLAGRGLQNVGGAILKKGGETLDRAVKPGYAQELAEDVVRAGSMVGGGVVGGPAAAAATGFASKTGIAEPIVEGLGRTIEPALRPIAPMVGQGLGYVQQGLGKTLQASGSIPGSVPGALTSLLTKQQLPSPPSDSQRVMEALQSNPQSLGKYSQELEAASKDEDTLKAAIIRLTQNDPEFRTQVLPHL